MKTAFSLLALVFFTLTTMAQNAAPVLSNLTVAHNPSQESVTFSFDVADAENDPVDLQLRISADSGTTWLVALDSVTGDTGYPQAAGSKSIVWVYEPAALAAAYATGPIAFEGRIVADDRQGVDIQAIVDQVDSTRVINRLRVVEGARNWQSSPGHLAETRDSIAGWMQAMGLQNWHYNWQQSVFNGRNLSGRKSGLLQEQVTWMVSAHYDSEPVPGADDNGTGTVGVLEAGEVLSQHWFRNSVRYLNFDLEEEGLLGSAHYVQNKIEPWEILNGLINLEMIGYKDTTPNSQSLPAGFSFLFPAAYQEVQADSFRGNFLTNVANVNSNPLKESFDSCAAAYVPDLLVISLAVSGNGQIAPDLRRSDHAPFWDGGYQALMLTDGANLRNPNYHQAGDTIGTLDLHFLMQNVRAVVATLAKLAQPLHADVAVGSPFVVTVPVALDPQNSSLVRVYPNPSNGAVHIDYGEWSRGSAEVRIVNGQGTVVLKRSQAAGENSLYWDARQGRSSALPAGVYFLTLESEGRKISREIRLLR